MIRVWDPFVRIFHWSLVAIVIANRFINDSGEIWHERLGYLACALIGARIAWGRKGPKHSVSALVVMILMLLSILLLGLSGWMMSWDRYFGEEWLEETHEIVGNVLVGLALAHVAGVIRKSVLNRENLVASMVHGKKRKR